MARLLIDVHQLLDAEHVVGDVVDEVAGRLLVRVVIHGDEHIVGLPPPVFLPLQFVALERAVAHRGECVVHPVHILAVDVHALDHTADLAVLGQLRILDGVGHLIRNDFPALFAVIRNQVREEHRHALVVFAHVIKRLFHQMRHQPVPHVFRIGRHAGHAAHVVHRAEQIDLHRVDADLRSQLFPVKPAERLRLFEHGFFAALHFLLVPAERGQLAVRHLKRITEQRVILRGIVHRQPAHLQSVFQLFLLHGILPVRRVVSKSVKIVYSIA